MKKRQTLYIRWTLLSKPLIALSKIDLSTSASLVCLFCVFTVTAAYMLTNHYCLLCYRHSGTVLVTSFRPFIVGMNVMVILSFELNFATCVNPLFSLEQFKEITKSPK